MRSSIAKVVAAALGLCIVSLSAVFAVRQNPRSGEVTVADSPAHPVLPTAGDEAEIEQGRLYFFGVGCTRCHSALGQGNPRYPLDDVGARRTASEIRAWMLGAGPVEDSLPRSVVRAKQRFQEEPEEVVVGLEVFLVSLRGGI